MKRSHPIFAALLLFVLWPHSSASPQNLAAARSWKVRLLLEARGEYRAEERGLRVDGSFQMAFDWSGTLEQSDEDFLLVHGACELKKWEIEERAQASESISILNTKDIPEKPDLKVDYILREKDFLTISFAVEGFEVPKNASAEGFYLVLPASAENSRQPGGINYNLFVKTGSNKVVLEEKRIFAGPAESDFGWTWKFQSWVQKQDQVVFQASSHEAKVKVVITPN